MNVKRAALLFAILAGVLWGTTGVFVRVLSDAGLNEFTVLGTRVTISALILLAHITLKRKMKLQLYKRDMSLYLGGAVIGNFGLCIFSIIAVKHLSLSFAAVLRDMYPFIVMFIAAVLFKEKNTRKKMICMLFAFFGCVLISGIFDGNNLTMDGIGLIAGILSAFSYAAYSIFTRVLQERGNHALTITLYYMMIATVILIPLIEWEKAAYFVSAAPFLHSSFLILHALCTGVVPYILYAKALHYLEAGKAAALSTSEPAAAMVFGLLFYSEVPTVIGMGGIVIVMSALIFLCLDKESRYTDE